MKNGPTTTSHRPGHIRIPAFLPVPGRARADGWTQQRQAAFLVALARTRSVAAAAREVGLSRVSAYNLRKRRGAASFVGIWDQVLGNGCGRQRKFTPEERFIAALSGRIKPQVWRGRCIAVEQKYDNPAFRGLVLRTRHFVLASVL